MIEEKDVLNISFYEYKVAFTGSFRGMRYRIAREPFEHVRYLPPEKKEGAKLKLSIWKEPYTASYAATYFGEKSAWLGFCI